MTTWVALLRGINLGNHNKMPMGDLEKLAGELGLAAPQTYLRSGNLVVDSDLSELELTTTIQTAIEDRFGFHVPTICRKADEFGQIASSHPFSSLGLDDRMLHVAFLNREADQNVEDVIDPDQYAPDRYQVEGREIYLAYPTGSGRSKLNHSLLESRLGVSVTARNWKTVTKLAEMIDSR